MRRFRPLRRIVGKDSAPLPESNWLLQFSQSRGVVASRYPRQLLDVLECGHKVGAEILAPKSRNPYIRKGEEVYRKCSECPRVERG